MLGGLQLGWWKGRSASQWSFYKCAAHLPVKVLPGVLRHQSEQREEGPTKWVKTGVAIIGVLSHSDASIPLWTAPATNTASIRFGVRRWIQSNEEQHLPSVTAISTEQRISFFRKVIMIFWRQKKKMSVLAPALAADSRLKALQYTSEKSRNPPKTCFMEKRITVMIVSDQMFDNIM